MSVLLRQIYKKGLPSCSINVWKLRHSKLQFVAQKNKEMLINTNRRMQMLIPISRVDTNNIYFAEKRKNMILDGNFVKIVYSTEHFEMNGLHLLLRIRPSSRFTSICSLDEQLRALFGGNTSSQGSFVERSGTERRGVRGLPMEDSRHANSFGSPKMNAMRGNETPVKFVEVFDTNLAENSSQIELLCNIEQQIVKNYIQIHAPNKIATHNLKYQMDTGSFRFTQESTSNKNADEYSHTSFSNCGHSSYALKISGIWETNTNVGITVKFSKLC